MVVFVPRHRRHQTGFCLFLIALGFLWKQFRILQTLTPQFDELSRLYRVVAPDSNGNNHSIRVEHSIRKLPTNVVQHNTSTLTIPNNITDQKRQLPGHKIFVTGPWVAEQIVQNNLQWNPTMEIHIFNNSAMARSVRQIDHALAEQGLPGAWKAWRSLRAWAYRADLWRLMILWSEGGVYLDSKMKALSPLSEWATLYPDQEQLAICHDNYEHWQSQRRGRVPVLWTGAMSAPKGSPVLWEAMRLLLINVNNRTYSLVGEEAALTESNSILAVTGPVLVGYAAALETMNSMVRVPCGFFHKHGGVLYQKPFQVNPEQKGRIMKIDREENQNVHASGNIYRHLHKARQIYCDDQTMESSAEQNTPCDVESLISN